MRKAGPAFLVVCALISFGPGLRAFGSDLRPLTLETMIGLKTVGNVSLSPDGKTVAFDATSVDWDMNSFKMDVWLAQADGHRCFQLTQGKAMNMAPAWSPDGRSLAFLSTRLGPPQVFQFRPGFGEPEVLFQSPNGVVKFAWSPDGKAIAFLTPESPDPAVAQAMAKGYDAQKTDDSPPRSCLFLYELASKTAKPLAPGDYHVMGFTWSPDGSRIAFVTSPKNIEYVTWDDQTVRTVRRDGSGPESLDFKYRGSLTRHGEPAWSPDGRFLALEAIELSRPELWNHSLLVYDLQERKMFSASGEADLFMFNVRYSADGKFIYFLAYRDLNSQFFRAEVSHRRVEQVSAFPKMEVNRFSMSADGRTVAFSASTPDTPSEVYLADVHDLGKARRLTDIHPEMAGTLVCPTEEISWKGDDGIVIHGNIVYPAGYVPGKRYPTLTLIHGGPAGNFNNSFNANYFCPAQYFAGRGYLVYLPDVRGSIGWGSEFMRMNYRDWGGGDYRDLMAGIDMLIDRGLADPDRLVAWGGSYGGYMANWIVTQTNRFKAVHSEVSISNLYSYWGISPIGRFLARAYFGKTPIEDPAIYAKLSPMTYAANVRTPLLLTQNEKDQRVATEQALEFYRAVELTGTPVEHYLYPGESHATLKPSHQLDKLRKTEAWFARFLKVP
jgi:dipeptidyl aminopeptidase/acylaminoacyl peptidase